MKLKDILTENTDNFRLDTTEIDPETGAVTSTVTYTNPLLQIDKDIEKVYENLIKAVEKTPNDEKLKQLFTEFSNWKKRFRRYGTLNKLYK